MHHSNTMRFELWFRSLATMALLAIWLTGEVSADTPWKVGAARRDLTPEVPIRLSGYSARPNPAPSIADRLAVRALVMIPPTSESGKNKPLVIVSIDAIGISAVMTEAIYQAVSQTLDVPREQFVICTTHSHTAPHLDGVIPNMFGVPLSDPEQESMKRYTKYLMDQAIAVVKEANERVRPAKLEYGLGRAEFAINRRMVQNQKWTGFGTVDDGPVDRTVRVIAAKDDKDQLIAVAYQYACHCTSISPEVNQVSGDWAGMSSAAIETKYKDCVALPIIGCGADANPNPRGTYENSVAHAASMTEAVTKVLSSELKTVPAPTQTAFTLVALASERPSKQKLEEMVNSKSAHERFFANSMLETLKHKDRIPESYPAPVHLWSFGNELAWVFMGGEVVVDYQIRLERELSQFANIWVAAYTDDVFAYVASERVRGEGGYEVDGSMLYYNQPGRWVSGTEDTIVARVLDMTKQQRPADKPLSADESLKCMTVPAGWKVELVASEPLVTDPINIAFGADGTVWVVEMGDYPQGGPKTGCIKALRDTDGDGKLDTAKVFIDGLNFPAGVYPWRDGIVVACAPDVFFIRDTNSDGIGDERIVLLSGFPEGNPQHRVHGFTYGLDHRLHFGPGGGAETVIESRQGALKSTSSKPAANDDSKHWIAGYDIALDPDRGTMERETGVTQYIRTCDDFGNWFGNENSLPMFHYVIDSRWLEHGGTLQSRRSQLMPDPPVAPPVFPTSRQLDRFNDLYAANRFTSACSTIIARVPGVGRDLRGMALVCEPVHNLVARFQVTEDGASWKARRYPEDASSDLLRSTDPWFRPVRVDNAPDGSIWVVDMYRYVIEHPEWIPEEWQRRMDVRAGENQGRIYRIYRDDFKRQPIQDLTKATNESLIALLESDNARLADLAQQQLIWRHQDGQLAKNTIDGIRQRFQNASEARARLRCFATLNATSQATPQEWQLGLQDADPRVAHRVVNWLDRSRIGRALIPIANQLVTDKQWKRSPSLALELLMLGSSPAKVGRSVSAQDLASILVAFPEESWIVNAASLIHEDYVDGVVEKLLRATENQATTGTPAELPVLEKLIPRIHSKLRNDLLGSLAKTSAKRPAWHYLLGRQFTILDSAESKLEAGVLKQLDAEAFETLRNGEANPNVQHAALAFVLSRMNQESTAEIRALRQVLRNSKDEDLGRAIARGLFSLGAITAKDLLTDWKTWSVSTRSVAIQSLVSREEFAVVLLEALREKRIPLDEIDAGAIARLRNFAGSSVRLAVVELFGPPPGADRVQIVRDALTQWPTKTDIVQGKELYTKHCAACHESRQSDGAVLAGIGPNLSALSAWNNEAWMTAVLDPNRSVEEKYRSFQMRTTDETIAVGLKVREDNDSIEWIGTDGRANVTRKKDISEMKTSNNSLMPEGFEKLVSPNQIADIVSYIRSKR